MSARFRAPYPLAFSHFRTFSDLYTVHSPQQTCVETAPLGDIIHAQLKLPMHYNIRSRDDATTAGRFGAVSSR
jgi:hypothetical protein